MFSEKKKKKLGNQQLWSTQIFPGLSSMEHRNGQIWKLIWMHSHRIKKKNLFCYWLFLAKFNSRVWFLQATAAIYSSTQKVAHKQQHSKVSHVIPQLQQGLRVPVSLHSASPTSLSGRPFQGVPSGIWYFRGTHVKPSHENQSCFIHFKATKQTLCRWQFWPLFFFFSLNWKKWQSRHRNIIFWKDDREHLQIIYRKMSCRLYAFEWMSSFSNVPKRSNESWSSHEVVNSLTN